jgi:hypothetical protein
VQKKTRRLTLELLEARDLPATWGIPWPTPGRLTVSFVPDGTVVDGNSSTLFQNLNGVAQTKTWQLTVLQALQTWASAANINLTVVPDGGQPLGGAGLLQGDARFGDIRVAAEPFGQGPLALSSPYDPVAGTRAGDIVFNSSQTFSLGGQAGPDLFTVALHEAGHVFGFPDQSTDPTSVMYAQYTGPRTGLSASDISLMQTLYAGPRTPDRYQGTTGDGSFATAAPMKLPDLAADVTTPGQLEFYRYTVPSYANRTITVRAQTCGLSLLTPRLSIFTASGQQITTSAAADPLSGDVSITLTNVKRGSVLFFEVQGARGDAFGVGGYRLKVDSGKVSEAQIAAIDLLLNQPTGITNFGASNDTLSTATQLDLPTFATSPHFAYTVNARLTSSSDVDFYSGTTPVQSGSGPAALVFTVTAADGSPLMPELTVYDAGGNQVNAQVLSNENSAFVVQVLNPGAGMKYYVEVSPNAFTAAAANQTGGYTLGVNYLSTPVVLESLVDTTLTSTSSTQVYGLQSTQAQLYHFVLSASSDGSVPNVAVRLQIYDQNNNVVLTLTALDGETISGDVLLAQGNYTARFVAAAQDGSAISNVTCVLAGTNLTDPLDPVPVDPNDPTLPPPTDPTPIVVTTPTITTLPPLDPTSNPWTTTSG